MRFFFRLVLLALLAAATWLGYQLLTPVPQQADATVILRPGWSSLHIARELQQQGVIRNGHALLLWKYLHPGSTLKAGEYAFGSTSGSEGSESSLSALDVYRKLVRGEVVVHTVVVPEGFTIWDIADAMEAAKLGSSADFLKLMQSPKLVGTLIGDLDPDAKSLEGYLFPDTYQFTRSQSPREMIAAMVTRFRKEAAALNLTATTNGEAAEVNSAAANLRRIVTLASIVEKETPLPAERPLVASVYANRLARNIALDADPTVIYAHLLRGDYSGALHHDDLTIDSPYNTYRYAGLPPGPIGAPGRESLRAAMNPAKTDFLYFVATGSGGSRFAKSLEEHNRNVNLFRRTLRLTKGNG